MYIAVGGTVKNGLDALYLVVWLVIFVGTIWGIFVNFGYALGPLRKESNNLGDSGQSTESATSESKSSQPGTTTEMERANEKLASLVRKQKDGH
jgi:hypothetical protein